MELMPVQHVAEGFRAYAPGSCGLAAQPRNPLGSESRCRSNELRMAPIGQIEMDTQSYAAGIPKVEYKVPGTNRSEWEDINTRLYRERIIFVSRPLDDEYTNVLISALLCLDNETAEKPITLYINSPGGPITAGLALFDTLKHLKSKIATINVGFCGATASLLLGAGTHGMRSALVHSRVLLHQPSGTLQGSAEQLKTEAKHLLEIKRMIQQVYSQITKQPIAQIVKDLERDNFLSAQESLQYGLIDRIIDADEQKTTTGDAN